MQTRNSDITSIVRLSVLFFNNYCTHGHDKDKTGIRSLLPSFGRTSTVAALATFGYDMNAVDAINEVFCILGHPLKRLFTMRNDNVNLCLVEAV